MWHTCSVRELSQALAQHMVDPWTLFTHFWQRMEAAPAQIWTFRNYASAAAQAQQSQQRWLENRRLGPLDGIGVALKDAIDVAGEVTTMASATRLHAAPAAADAPLVQRLRAQGLVLMGRTNLSEFAFSGLGINPHFGTPALRNAWGEACAPGGSSSGSAMALVHGLVPLAVGTDTSGSVRIPCAWNGLVGLRPGSARYPAGGIFPLAPALDVCGPMGRSVDDVRWLDAVMAGHDALEPVLPPSASQPRLWVPEGQWLQGLDVSVEAAWQQAMARLAQQGWQIEVRPMPVMQAAMALQAREGMLVSAQAARIHSALLDDPDALAQLHAPVRERLLQARQLPAEVEHRLLHERAQLCAQWQQSLGTHTLVCMPTTQGLAPALERLLHDDQAFAAANLRALRNTFPSSFLDAPSLTLPLPAATGRHCGMQLSTVPGGEDALLAVAAQMEQQLAASH